MITSALSSLQIAVVPLIDATGRTGSVMATGWSWIQPWLSVTVQVYEPTLNPVPVAPVPPIGDYEYV
ncbi:hypothetical protein CJD36_018620 [Flavipsychrobacter stenotrophus]|uniref:Uncharacterized protein n=1 Tax=Flavipsychrobacter stenotrophus TaxID=2077091 RepID=A0A2S7SR93_9BACT|nr:hypothetical protein CJD36_018620 [Flavipsychrobacter stenotrophus]